MFISELETEIIDVLGVIFFNSIQGVQFREKNVQHPKKINSQ